MVRKKRVTLPKDFKELVEIGDIEKLKAIYNLCELSAAYDGRTRHRIVMEFPMNSFAGLLNKGWMLT